MSAALQMLKPRSILRQDSGSPFPKRVTFVRISLEDSEEMESSDFEMEAENNEEEDTDDDEEHAKVEEKLTSEENEKEDVQHEEKDEMEEYQQHEKKERKNLEEEKYLEIDDEKDKIKWKKLKAEGVNADEVEKITRM